MKKSAIVLVLAMSAGPSFAEYRSVELGSLPFEINVPKAVLP